MLKNSTIAFGRRFLLTAALTLTQQFSIMPDVFDDGVREALRTLGMSGIETLSGAVETFKEMPEGGEGLARKLEQEVTALKGDLNTELVSEEDIRLIVKGTVLSVVCSYSTEHKNSPQFQQLAGACIKKVNASQLGADKKAAGAVGTSAEEIDSAVQLACKNARIVGIKTLSELEGQIESTEGKSKLVGELRERIERAGKIVRLLGNKDPEKRKKVIAGVILPVVMKLKEPSDRALPRDKV